MRAFRPAVAIALIALGVASAAFAQSPPARATATIGGKTATVQYAGSALGLVDGVVQVNVIVPAGVTAGAAVPVTLQVGSNNTPPGVTIAVSN